MAATKYDEYLPWNPIIFKDPWVELSALIQDEPEQQRQLIGAALQLQRDILTAQLKAVDTLQALAKRTGEP
jgi:hypothetical protein